MEITNQIKVMQSFSEGKTIESRDILDMNSEWKDDFTPSWNFEKKEYRIKPLQVRPYTLQEFISQLKIHGLVIKEVQGPYYYTIASFTENNIGYVDCYEGDTAYYGYDYYPNRFVWADDESPVGMIENYN